MSALPNVTTNRALPVENSLLAALPHEAHRLLLPHLELVHLRSEQVLYERGEVKHYVYFPTGAVVSLLTLLEDGATVEVGMIGRRGLVGACAILGSERAQFWTVAQIEGAAWRMRLGAFNDWCERSSPLRRLLNGYYQALVTQFCQRAVCNCRHTTTERLCTWLLMLHDRAGADNLKITQDLIARRLGTRRATVTEVYTQLQFMGALRYGRGHVTIRCRGVLQELACECYAAMEEDVRHYLGGPAPAAPRQTFI